MNRRNFIQLMGLAGGASVINSCGMERQTEKIIPYVVPPDDGTIPRVASYVNTTSTATSEHCGIAAKVIDYRVGKLEGLDGHPLNDGALSAIDQASLAKLYHPERLKSPLRRRSDGQFEEITWDEALGEVAGALATDGSRRDVLLSGRLTGTLSGLVDEFCADTGVERLPAFEVYPYAAIREANRIVFGRAELPSYRIDNADFLLTLGADILETFASPVSHGVQFGRAKKNPGFAWYHVEPHTTLASFAAKHRYAIAPAGEVYLLINLLRRVARANVAGERHISELVEALPDVSDQLCAEHTGLSIGDIEDIATHMLEARRPLVVSGGVSTMQAQGLDVAVLTAALQWALGMTENTVDFSRAHDFDGVGDHRDASALLDRLDSGRIGVFFVTGADPAGQPGATARWQSAMGNARLRVGMDQFMTPTLEGCDIVLPMSDGLESWGDVRPRRGYLGIIQPAVEPVHDTLVLGECLLRLLALRQGDAVAASYQQYVFSQWKTRYSEREIDRFLQSGYVEEPVPVVAVNMDRAGVAAYFRGVKAPDTVSGTTLIVAPSLRALDGRTRNLPLLQEVPDPLTTVTWGQWVSVSPETAQDMGVTDREEVTVSAGNWSADMPVVLQPGLRRGTVMTHYTGMHSTPHDVLQDSGEMNARFDGVRLTPTGRTIPLPVLSGSKSQEGRGIIPDPSHGHDDHHHGVGATLYPENPYKDYRWGMAIDLDLCTGCSACAVACYVENNVPVVGPELHLDGREMSWIRMEPFYEGDKAQVQPMLCQHCSNAPCETVCPVYATYHNENGLNAQIYNRCVGTRYCANNCPYKVRRFNWFDTERPTDMNSTRNPEVSIRGRGVMEKCTFCVQRVRSARDTAKDEKRKINDGEVMPACAQTCPTNAITFGNLLDENSQVSKWAKSERAYRVLEPLGTSPAVHYLSNRWKKDHA